VGQPTAVQDELVGRTLDGKYQLYTRLGAGGMGAVYLGRRLHIGDEVAVKVLHAQYLNDAAAVARFRREAMAAARLRHPNVVAIYDFGEARAGEPAYIVMELVNGVALRDLLKQERRLEANRAIRLMREICAGVGAAHRQNIIHRDLKPDNVIVVKADESGELHEPAALAEKVKVLDFGIAKLRDLTPEQSLTQTGLVLGTPYYMSPEQCRGDALDARSDVYSLAAMLYEMLTGLPPFTANTITGVVAKHLTETPVPLRTHLETISPSLEAVVSRALAKDPRLRQQDAQAFARELQKTMQGPPTNLPMEESIARTTSGTPSLGPVSPFLPAQQVFDPAAAKVTHGAAAKGGLHYDPGRFAGDAVAAVAAAAGGLDGAAEVKRLNGRLIFGVSVVVALLVLAAGAAAWLMRERLGALPRPTPAVTTPSPLAAASPSPGYALTATTEPVNSANNAAPAVEISRIESAEALLVNGQTLTEKDLAGLSVSELRLLRNTIFARHGRIFDTPGLQKYFATRAWYKVNVGYNDTLLEAIDRENLGFIFAFESKAKAALNVGAQASSKLEKYTPDLARDERFDTAWMEGANGAGIGEWIAFTFKPQTIQTVEIYSGFGKSKEAFGAYPRVKRATLIFSDGTRAAVELFDEMRLQTVRLSAPVKTSSLRLIIDEVYPGAQFEETAISEINWR
jgi:serine/threonine-protein kinase